MHTLHFPAHREARSYNLYALAVGAVFCFALALASFLLSWYVGGPAFKDSLGGNWTLALLLLGLAISTLAARAAWARRVDSRAQPPPSRDETH